MVRRRLALVIPSLVMGGMEKVMVILANYLSTKSDIEVHLITLAKKENYFSLNKNPNLPDRIAMKIAKYK